MSITKASLIDLNGQELILDADADTSITADTDDQIDIKIAGSDVITLTSSGITSSAGATITVADNSDTLTLVSTDTDASSGPVLNLFRNSASAADSDVLAKIDFTGKNDAGSPEDVRYVRFFTKIIDASDGSEDGQLHINTMIGGALTQRVTASPTELIINDGSADTDFRVESNGKSHMLFVDGGEDLVLIGTGTKSVVSGGDPGLQVSGSGFDSIVGITRHDANAFAAQLMLAKSRNATVGSNTILQDGDGVGAIGFFADDGTNLDSQVAYITAEIDGTPGANDTPGRLKFSTTADGSAAVTERMRIASDGTTTIGRAITTTYDNDQGYPLHIQASGGSQTYLAISAPGDNSGDTGVVIGHDGTGTRIVNRENEPIIFHNASSSGVSFTMEADGDFSIADGNVVVASGHGISFAATSDATGAQNELLDDYEEGVWTPSLTNGGSIVNMQSNYTKIGRLVHITSYLQTITPTNNSSPFLIGGLPFTVWGSGYTYSAGSFSYIGTSSGNVNKFGMLASTGSSYLYFHFIDGSGGGGVTNAQWISEMGSGSGIHLIFHAFFYEDS